MCLENMERRLLFRRQSSDSDENWVNMPILTKVMEGIVKLSPSGGSEVKGDGNPPLPPTPTVSPISHL